MTMDIEVFTFTFKKAVDVIQLKFNSIHYMIDN